MRARSVPALYPTLIVLVFWAMSTYEGGESWLWTWRATIAGIVLLWTLQTIAWVVMRSQYRSALSALSIWFWLLGEPPYAQGVLVVLLLAEIVMRVRKVRGRHVSGYDRRFTYMGNVIGAITLLVAILPNLPAHLWFPQAISASRSDTGADGPDIFVILVDGYPRQDTLLQEFDFDNQPFVDELEMRGFKVAANSRANYNYTRLTLATMLNMRHALDMPELTAVTMPDERRRFTQAIEFPSAFRLLREDGYAIHVIATPFSALSPRVAQSTEHPYLLNYFEVRRLDLAARRGPLGRFMAPILESTHRAGVTQAFADLRELARPGDRPRLIWAHLMIPHPPFLFGANGEPRSLSSCFPSCGFWDGTREQLARSDFAAAASDQVEFTNRELVHAIDLIIGEATQPPVIILLSDHGSRHSFDNTDEMFRTLFAAYTPGHPRLFEDDVSPIVVFPRLLNAYLDHDVPEPAGAQYLIPLGKEDEGLLRLIEVTVR